MRERQYRPNAVLKVVLPKGRQVRVNVVMTHNVRVEHDPAAGLPQPAIEFEVLTTREVLVEQPHSLEHVPPVAAAEHRVGLDKFVTAYAEIRIAGTEAMAEATRDGLTDQSRLAGMRRDPAAHVVSPRALEHLDAPP